VLAREPVALGGLAAQRAQRAQLTRARDHLLDTRHAEPVPYITQLMLALSGGPGIPGHDGWLTYESTAGNGIMVSDSIEVDEAALIKRVENRANEARAKGEPVRADDDPETFKKRLAVYKAETAPVLPYYDNQGKTKRVDGMKSIDEVTAQIEAVAARAEEAFGGADILVNNAAIYPIGPWHEADAAHAHRACSPGTTSSRRASS